MSSLDFTGLGDLAKKTPGKAWWEPLTLAHLGEGEVLAFDQSLTASGWVQARRTKTALEVVGAGKFGGGHDELKRGVEQDLRRSVSVFDGARLLIAGVGHRSVGVAHESPPNAQAVKGSGTSSLMAGTAVRIAAHVEGVSIQMLGAQPAKKLVCGNANADKATAHKALKEHCFGWIEGSHLVTNEATRDALMVALLYLARERLADGA